MEALPTELMQEVIELSFFRSPTAETIGRLKLVCTKWRDFIELHTTFRHTEQQPYDVVFGVLVAIERPFQPDMPRDHFLIEIKPPKHAKLRVVPDKAFEDPSGLIVSVDFSSCDELETIGANAFRQSPLFKVNLSGCINLGRIRSSAFGTPSRRLGSDDGFFRSEDYRMDEIPTFNRLKLVEIVPTFGRLHFGRYITELSFSGCAALREIESCAFSGVILNELDLTSCVALEHIGGSAFKEAILGTLNLSSCIALKRIGDGAFLEAPLATLNLSGCTALETIEKRAFFSADLTTLDLSSCVALQTIEALAFRYSPLELLDLSFTERTEPLAIGSYCFASSQIPELALYGLSTELAPGRYRV
jgi:hypothetical protein